MKVAKLVKISTAMLKLLSENGIKVDDYRYVDAYYDFLNMRDNRIKHRSAIKMIADDLKVSERTLERVFKRLSRIVN
jgi:AraC-like DNA-binding protein